MDDICGDVTGPTRIACQKLLDHKGERHGFDLGFMSAAWVTCRLRVRSLMSELDEAIARIQQERKTGYLNSNVVAPGSGADRDLAIVLEAAGRHPSYDEVRARVVAGTASTAEAEEFIAFLERTIEYRFRADKSQHG